METNLSGTGKLSVNLTHGEVAVPNTGASTRDGSFNSASIVGAGILILLFVAVAILASAVMSHKSHKVFVTSGSRGKMKITKKSRGIFGVMAVVMLVGAFGVMMNVNQSNINGANAIAGEVDDDTDTGRHATGNTLTIEVKGADINAVLEDGVAYATGAQTVKVKTGTDYGYILAAYASDADMVNEEDENHAIESLPETDGLSALGANTWGVALEEPKAEGQEIWSTMSADKNNPFIVKDSIYVSQADEEVKVYYGVKANDKLPEGEYSTTINYMATAYVAGDIAGPNTVSYDDNGANSPTGMGVQHVDVGSTGTTLWASNFQRPGYGFAGWNTRSDGSGEMYGPNERLDGINLSEAGMPLYAMWVKSEGSLQRDAEGVCKKLATAELGVKSLDSVSALTDERDEQTYAIARLADGNCWMIENLRLDAEATRGEVNETLAQGYNKSETYGNFVGLADSETENFANVATANSLYYSGTQSGDASVNIGSENNPGYRFPRYNNTNTSSTIKTMTSIYDNVYTYGNYYTWAAAMASTEPYSNAAASDVADTSLCPKGWRLPYGNNSGNGNSSGGYSYLDRHFGGDGVKHTSGSEGKERSEAWRKFPYNYLYSGYINTSSIDDKGVSGRYWSSSAKSISQNYTLFFKEEGFWPGDSEYQNYYARTVRCVKIVRPDV